MSGEATDGLVQAAVDAEQKLKEQDRSEFDDLPSGHPLRLAMEEAKRRYEERLAEQQETEQTKARRAVRMKDRKKDAESKRKEESEKKHGKAVDCIGVINDRIDEFLVEIEKLANDVNENMEGVREFPQVRLHVRRLHRMLLAVHRGVEGSKLNASKVGGE